jgi:hypothetical protein
MAELWDGTLEVPAVAFVPFIISETLEEFTKLVFEDWLLDWLLTTP